MAVRTDRLLDALIVLLATGTVVYHAALLLDLPSNAALGVVAVLMISLSVVEVRRRSTPEPRSHSGALDAWPWTASHLDRRSAVVVVVAAAVSAVAMAATSFLCALRRHGTARA